MERKYSYSLIVYDLSDCEALSSCVCVVCGAQIEYSLNIRNTISSQTGTYPSIFDFMSSLVALAAL